MGVNPKRAAATNGGELSVMFYLIVDILVMLLIALLFCFRGLVRWLV